VIRCLANRCPGGNANAESGSAQAFEDQLALHFRKSDSDVAEIDALIYQFMNLLVVLQFSKPELHHRKMFFFVGTLIFLSCLALEDQDPGQGGDSLRAFIFSGAKGPPAEGVGIPIRYHFASNRTTQA